MAVSSESMTRTLTFSFDAKKDQAGERDYLLGMNELLRRANVGNLSAQFLCGMGFNEGRFGFPVNPAEALKWLRAAKEKFSQNEGRCARSYCEQYGLLGETQDIYEALGGYIGSDSYMPAKYLAVETSYNFPFQDKEKNQPLTDNDIQELYKDLVICKDANFIPAIAFLGKLKLIQKNKWCDSNVPEGLQLLKTAATHPTQGDDAPTCFFLGDIYQKGLHGVKADPKQAKVWYKKAQDLGYPGADDALKSCSKCNIM